jgi:hypothetical protein
LILPHAGFERERSGLDRRNQHAFVQNLLRAVTQIAIGVLLHLVEHELLIERAAVDADAHRFVVVDRHLADSRKTLVTPCPRPDVARVDAVFVERRRAVRVPAQEQMTVVMEVADERRIASRVDHAPLDRRDCGRGFLGVDGDANQLRSRFRQFDALARGPFDIRGLCHCHRLHGNWRTAAYLHVADADAYGLVQPDGTRTRAAHSTNHTG